MAISKSGGIYITIGADIIPLEQALANVKRLANSTAKDIGNAFEGAMTPETAARINTSLSKSFAVASSSAKALKTDLSQFEAHFKNMGKSIGLSEQNLQKFAQAQTRALQKSNASAFTGALREVQRATGASNTEMNRLSKSLGGVGNEFNKAASQAKGFSVNLGSISALVGGFAGFSALKDIAKTSVDLASMQKTFFALTGSVEGARGEISWLRDESQRLGLDFFALTSSFKGFSAAGKTAAMSAAEVRNIFTAVSEASTVLGLNADKTKLALYALEQMLSKGAVSMEELRRQLGDQLPGAFQLGAKAMGLTTMEFSKLVKSGQLASEEFLPKFAEQLRNMYGPGLAEAMKTPRAELQRLVNTVTFAKAEIGEAGFLQGISEAAKELNASLQTEAVQANLHQLGRSLGEITGALSKISAVAINNSTGLLAIAAGFGTAAIAGRTLVPILKYIILDLATMPRTMAGVAVSARDMGAAFTGAFGGPVGIAITAVAGGIAYLALQQSEAEKIAAKYGTTIADIEGKYRGIEAAAREAAGTTRDAASAMAEADRKMQLDTAEKSLKRTQKEVISLREELDTLSKRNDISLASGTGGIELFPDINTTKFTDAIKSIIQDFNNGKISAIAANDALKALKKEVESGINDSAFYEFTERSNLKRFNEEIDEATTLIQKLAGSNSDIDTLTQSIRELAAAGRALPDSQLWIGEAIKTAADMEKRINDAFEDTKEGKAEALLLVKESADASVEWAKAHGASAETIAKATANAAKAQKDYNKSIAPEKTSSASSSVNKLESAVKSANDELNRLTMTEKEHAAFQFSQKIAEWEKLGVSMEKIAELQKAFDSQQVKKSFDEASKALQDFEKEYQQTFKHGADLTASIAAEMDKTRDAVIALWQKDKEHAEKYITVLERINELEQRRLEDASKDPWVAAKRSLEEYAEAAMDASANVKTFTESVLSSMEDALVDFVSTGKASFSDLVDSIIADLARLAIRQTITGPLSSALSGMLGGTEQVWDFSYIWPSAQGYAQGGAVSSPALSSFSNSIVSSPTVFPFAKGIGLMGEAGAEAIMPLTRTSTGDLGVSVDIGGERQTAAQTNIQIVDQRGGNAPEVEVQQSMNSSGGMDYKLVIKSEQQRNMSNGAMDGIMRSRYGISPQVVRRG